MKELGCGQSDIEGLHNQNMTVFTISSELMMDLFFATKLTLMVDSHKPVSSGNTGSNTKIQLLFFQTISSDMWEPF